MPEKEHPTILADLICDLVENVIDDYGDEDEPLPWAELRQKLSEFIEREKVVRLA